MYHKTAISKLSHAQIGKLLNGHRIRVKHGAGMEIHASAEQHKKIAKAHQKGCGTTIQFDPYQIQHHQYMRGHGEGMFGSIAKGAFKALAPVAIDALTGLAKNHIGGMGYNPRHPIHHYAQDEALSPAGSALFPAGYGVNPAGLGAKTSRRVGRPRGRGEGFFGDVAKGAFKTLAPIAIDAGADYLKNRAGSGVGGAKGARKGRRGKGVGGAKGARKGRRGKGEGVGEDILNGIAQYAPLALSFL